MDKTIDITIRGSYLRKNNNSAGVQGEANVTILHFIFDEAWEGLAKSVTFWNSRGENPVKRTLTNDLLVDINVSLLEYNVPIPSEPLEFAGDMTFVIDGYLDGKRKRSMQDTLSVEAALMTDTENEPADITPTQAEQLQTAIEAILPQVQEESKKAQEFAEKAEEEANKAEQAISDVQGYVESASASASEAKASAERAESSAARSENAKTEIEQSVSKVESAVSTVTSAEQSAISAKDTALASATTATEVAQTATTAKNTAVSAKDTAVSSSAIATTKANEASLSAENAYTSEVNAKVSEASAEADALLSKSYAVGGTGVRQGENTDNAKFYCEQAQAAAGGDYVTNPTFNAFVESSFNPLAQEVSENSDLIADVNGKTDQNTKDISSLNQTVSGHTTSIEALNKSAKLIPSTEQQQTWTDKVGMVNNKTGVAITLTASDVGAVDTGTFDTTVEGINTTVNGIGDRTTTLEDIINSLINGEAVQY